jgi:acyl carrier protein
MPERAPTMEQLLTLPRSEAAEAVEAVVVEEFKTTLLMSAEEELPVDAGFFDALGLSSLRLTEIKRRLEARLGCDISANVLFNRPTVRQLVSYLADELLPAVPADATTTPQVSVPAATPNKALVDDLLEDLYRA